MNQNKKAESTKQAKAEESALSQDSQDMKEEFINEEEASLKHWLYWRGS